MIHDQPILLLSIGGSILALVSAACLLLCGGTDEQEVARCIGKLREGATVVGPQSSRFVFALISSMRR